VAVDNIKDEGDMPKLIHFDIMLNGRFVATEHIPITPDVMCADPNGGGKKYIDMDAVQEKMLAKRPTLRGLNYRICF